MVRIHTPLKGEFYEVNGDLKMQVEKIVKVKDGIVDEMMSKANVVGVGVGKQIRDGVETKETVIRVYVSKKIGLNALSAKDIVAKTVKGITTDVIEVGEIKALGILDSLKGKQAVPNRTVLKTGKDKVTAHVEDRKKRYRPVAGGVSIGNIKITAGTASCKTKAGGDGVQKNADHELISGMLETGKIYSLSNAHVFCENPTLGVSLQERKVCQPGKVDGGNASTDLVGELKRFVLIQPGKMNYVDCALFEPYQGIELSSSILEIGVPKGVRVAKVEQDVKKSGRTTSVTYGRITDINASIKVSYGSFTATYTDQVIIQGNDGKSFSSGGDSGSLVMDSDGYAVGLLFAGSGVITVANKIQNVLKPLGVEIVSSDEDEAPAVKDFKLDVTMAKKNTADWKLYGTVSEQSGTSLIPLKGVVVSVGDAPAIVTDATGNYSKIVPEGAYRVQFTLEGYDTVVVDINLK